jgi:uncharacterized protein YndB with AHSA1/START domain
LATEIERSVEVGATLEDAWAAFTDADRLQSWFVERVEVLEVVPGGRFLFSVPSLDVAVEGRVEEVNPFQLLRWREYPGWLPGPTTVTATFMTEGSKTRIDITHAGFAESADWWGLFDMHSADWDRVVADLALYLESGAHFPRSFSYKSQFGLIVSQSLFGVRVVRVRPGSFGEAVGFESEDLILQIGAAPIFKISDLLLLQTIYTPGDRVEAVFLRHAEVRRQLGTV